MRITRLALSVLALVLSAHSAFAIWFSPLPGIPAPQSPALRWKVGLAASSWDLPEAENLLAPGDMLRFDSRLRPLVTLDYQATPRLTLGGWYNSVVWDVVYRAPSGAESRLGRLEGDLFELQGTLDLDRGWSAQAGYQGLSTHASIPQRPDLHLSGDLADVWVLKTLQVPGRTGPRWSFLLGAGATQGLNRGSGATAAQALTGVSYRLNDRTSADLSAWFYDIARGEENRAIRVTAGLTTRF